MHRILPRRAGSKPVDHAITYFNRVDLPRTALLGDLSKPKSLRQNFDSVIWRVGVGSLALSTASVPTMKASLFVAGRYSIRRKVLGVDGKPMSIITFRTQQLPLLYTLAQTFVLEAYAKDAAEHFVTPGLHPGVRHGIATTLKAVMVQHLQSSLYMLAERCGAQGLYEHNQIIATQVRDSVDDFFVLKANPFYSFLQLEMRGNAIAEGDVLALCIRE
jgi:acyl-CoA oxidase